MISIIVPVYNVEKYLEKCLNSIINQTYTNYELILINDGSTDKSGAICDKYSRKYDFIKVIHQKNSGQSIARNKGLDIMKGEYVTFIDSDDFISENYLEVLINLLKEYDADIVISRLEDINESEEIRKIENTIISYVISKEEAYKKMLLQEDIDVNATARLYKKKIFEKLKFPEKKVYEDFIIISEVIEKCNKIVYTSYKGYYYLQRSGSTMYSEINEQKVGIIDAAYNLLTMIKEKYPRIEYAGVKRYIYSNFHILGRAINDKNYKAKCIEIRKNIMKYRTIILFNKNFTKKEKLATIILSLGLSVYKIFWNSYYKKIKKM